MKTGIELIAEERQRQLAVEGYGVAHDDAHEGGELASAAAVYAEAAGAIWRGASPGELHGEEEDSFSAFAGFDGSPTWPFEWAALKLSPDPIRNLQKAGALVAAEIDRLIRAGRMTALPNPPKPETPHPELFAG